MKSKSGNRLGRDPIEQALRTDRTIDITTIGRKSGRPRRIEIWFYNLDDRLFITGLPGTRDWYANLMADPALTFHLKGSIQADVPGKARPVLETAERRAVLEKILRDQDPSRDMNDWLAGSPLVEVLLDLPPKG